MRKKPQHPGFPCGPPPWYWLGSTLVNFADRTGCGGFKVLWPWAESGWEGQQHWGPDLFTHLENGRQHLRQGIRCPERRYWKLSAWRSRVVWSLPWGDRLGRKGGTAHPPSDQAETGTGDGNLSLDGCCRVSQVGLGQVVKLGQVELVKSG